MKSRYSTSEIIALDIPGIPTSKSGLKEFARKQGWICTKVSCKGGVRNEYTLPAAILVPIHAEKTALLDNMASSVTTPPAKHTQLTTKQHQVASARLVVLKTVEIVMDLTGATRNHAIHTVLMQAQDPRFPHLTKMVEQALDKRGTTSGLPTIRTINRWFAAQKANRGLAPKAKQTSKHTPAWGNLFLECWQQPQKQSIQAAYKQFCVAWSNQEPPQTNLPSIHQVRRFISKLNNANFHKHHAEVDEN